MCRFVWKTAATAVAAGTLYWSLHSGAVRVEVG